MNQHLLKKLLGTVVCTLLLLTAQSQMLKEEYKSAVITIKTGEKIEGYIDQDELPKIMNQIKFKKNISDQSYILYDTSSAVIAFAFRGGDEYELINFPINKFSTKITGYAKVLVKGKAILYRYIYASEDIYIIKNNGNIYVLQNDVILSDVFSSSVEHFQFEELLSGALETSDSLKVDLSRIEYSESYFIKVVSNYNIAKGAQNIVVKSKWKPIHYTLFSVGNFFNVIDKNEWSAIGLYRTYLPQLSKSISVNIGLTYFTKKYTKILQSWTIPVNKDDYFVSMFAMPVFVQENLLQKDVRPYIFVGLDAYYKVFELKNSLDPIPLKENYFGVNILWGGGVEVDLFKGLFFKGEYRFDTQDFMHLGVGYYFKK